MARQWLSRTFHPSWSLLILLTALLATLFPAPGAGAEGALSGELICLDPGHGGSDPGAVNGFLLEKEINLDVSLALGWLLSQEGVDVIMTRSDDTYLTNRDRYTFCNNQGATLLISVHTNSWTDTSWDGSTTLYSRLAYKPLAQAIHAELYPYLRDSAPDPDGFTDYGLTKFQSGVLLKSDMPSAMMEPVFMSNPAEAALLGVPVYDLDKAAVSQGCPEYSCRRGQIVQAIYRGILNYYGYLPTPEPTPTATPEPTATIPPEPTPIPSSAMHVAAIDMAGSQKGVNVFVDTKVTILDSKDGPVLGATVTLKTTLPDGSAESSTALTDENGVASFVLKTRQLGTYTSEVTGVSKDGWTYAGASVENPVSIEVVDG